MKQLGPISQRSSRLITASSGCRKLEHDLLETKTRRIRDPCSRVFRSMDYETPHCVESLFPSLSREPDCRNNLIDIPSPSRGKRSKESQPLSVVRFLASRRGTREARRRLEYLERQNNRKILTLESSRRRPRKVKPRIKLLFKENRRILGRNDWTRSRGCWDERERERGRYIVTADDVNTKQ